MVKLPIFFAMLLGAQSAFAGGYHVEVLVESFEISTDNPTSFQAVLSPRTEQSAWPAGTCQNIRLIGEFDARRWRHYNKPMSLAAHREALAYLSTVVGKHLLLGVIGQGLVQTKPCHFQSKGLFIQRHGEQQTVYSVYELI